MIDKKAMKARMKGRMKMDYAKLKESAADTLHGLEKIDPAKMSKEQFMLAGAATAILDHADTQFSVGGTQNTTHGTKDSDSIPYAGLAHDELRDADKYHRLYESTKNKTWEHIAKQELGHCAAILDIWEHSATAQGDKNDIAEIRGKLMQMEKVIK